MGLWYFAESLRMANHPGHQALRKGRVSLPGEIYLLTTTTFRRMPWFRHASLARATCRMMIEPKTWGDAHLLCWVLMPDHWHGLIQLGEHDDLSVVAGRFKALSAKAAGYGRGGCRLWDRGFHDHALRREENVAAVARYIVANPVRAGLVRRALDYPYWDCTWLP